MKMKNDVSESDVVACFDKEALALKLVPVKVTPLGVAGFPDKIYFGHRRIIFFVEFKRPGKKPRSLQIVWHKLLKKMGFNVHVFSYKDSEAARKICSAEIQSRNLPRSRN